MYVCVGCRFLADALKQCSSASLLFYIETRGEKKGIYLRNTIILFSPVSHFTWLLPDTYVSRTGWKNISLSSLVLPIPAKICIICHKIKAIIVWLKLLNFDLEIPPWQHLIWSKNLPCAHPVYTVMTLWSGDNLLWCITCCPPEGREQLCVRWREKACEVMLGYRIWVRIDTAMLQKHCVSVHVTSKDCSLVQQTVLWTNCLSLYCIVQAVILS